MEKSNYLVHIRLGSDNGVNSLLKYLLIYSIVDIESDI